MLHSATRDPRRIAIALLDFARSAAETRMLLIRGDISTPGPIRLTENLTIRQGDRHIVLIGQGQDVAYSEEDHHAEIEAMFASGTAVIDLDGQIFPINGPTAASRPNKDAFLLEVTHVRSNGQPSGAVGRLLLVVDRAAGVVTPEPASKRLIQG